MAHLLFPDNTVLVNFGLMGRVDLFAELVDGRGAWTNTIAEECRRSSRQAGLESLARMPEILGAALIPTPVERIDTLVLRERLAAPGEARTAHLGESEALAILVSRRLSAVFITDDRGAARLAAAEDVQVRTYTTGDLLRLAVRSKRLDADTAWDLVTLLRSKSRHVPGMPESRVHFDHWIQ